tara:strand:- start:3736 stop:4521 length:786 start_codon:yes stop_codon:yes gene_type:complete
MEDKLVYKILEANTWKFSKRAKDRNPHWYSLLENWTQPQLFKDVVNHIRSTGNVQWFWNMKYVYFEHNGWKYWTMDEKEEDVTLINRAFMSEQYDRIAFEYNDVFKPDVSFYNQLKSEFKDKTVLDVGCGNGALLMYSEISKDNYTGIDPSWKLIKQAKGYFEGYKFRQEKIESWHKKHDYLVSMFGSANYSLKDYVYKLNELADRHYIMFYDSDPIHYLEIESRLGYKMTHFKWSVDELKQIFPLSDIYKEKEYIIVNSL